MGREHGDIHWSELMTRDAKAAAAFFEKTVGWTFQAMPMPDGATYHVAMKGETPMAGIFTISGPQFEGSPVQWMTYIAVDDIDQTLKDVTEAGGVVLQPAFDVPGVGRIAMVQDPTGGTVGMMTPATPQAPQ